MDSPDENQARRKIVLRVYLDLERNSYRYFVFFDTNVTSEEIIRRILNEYVEEGEIESKINEFSLYLINSVILENQVTSHRAKSMKLTNSNSEFENMIDSADSYPNVLKSKSIF